MKNQETREAVSDAFIFFESSSIGTITDDKGYYQLEGNSNTNGNLIFSHINYKLKSISTKGLPDTIYLTPQQFLMEEVVISKKLNWRKKRKRKKWLKKFQEAFLGTPEKKETIEILNPEVILFEENRGVLTAQANEPLIIKNQFLGYKILFYLETFRLYPDKVLKYQGNAFFEELDGSRKEKVRFKRNRKKTYQKGSRNFFNNLISQNLDQEKHKLGYATLDNNREVTEFQPLNLDSLNIQKKDSENYEIQLDGVFSVLHKKITITENSSLQNRTSISVSMSNLKANLKQSNATTCFISKSNKIQVNRYGRILNPLEIEEVGFWAESRIASLLPLDYLPAK